MHKRNLATMWLPWTPTREEPLIEVELKPVAKPNEEKWVMEEEKLKNTPAANENVEDKVTRLLFGMDIKRTVL